MLKRVFILVILMLFSVSILAQYDHPRKKDRSRTIDSRTIDSRNGRFEAALVLPYQNSVSASDEEGSAVDVDSSMGWGFSLGWNWTEQVNLSYKYMMNKPKYEATFIPDDLVNSPVHIGYKMSKTSHQLNATYNILKRPLTPFIAGGVGYTKLNSNIPNGLDRPACWWDPWYGYICSTEWNTFKASEFTYNVGVGLRWDFSDFMFTKAAYTKEFLSLDKGSLDFDYLTLELGLMF